MRCARQRDDPRPPHPPKNDTHSLADPLKRARVFLGGGRADGYIAAVIGCDAPQIIVQQRDIYLAAGTLLHFKVFSSSAQDFEGLRGMKPSLLVGGLSLACAFHCTSQA